MNIRKLTLIILIVVALLIGGVGVYAATNIASDDETRNQTTTQQTAPTQQQPTEEETTPPVDSDSQTQTQTIDDVTIPTAVTNQIKQDYPDYTIDDVDREVENGATYYEVELEHKDPANNSEHELRYDENWEFISVRSDNS